MWVEIIELDKVRPKEAQTLILCILGSCGHYKTKSPSTKCLAYMWTANNAKCFVVFWKLLVMRWFVFCLGVCDPTIELQ